MSAPTSQFTVTALEPFPVVGEGDDLARTIVGVVQDRAFSLQHDDILVVASKVVSMAERRRVDLDTVTPGRQALELSAKTGKPAEIVQLVLDESAEHYLATERGPIIARHHLGYTLTSAGIDRDGTDGAWLLPADPDASARALRDAIAAATGTTVAVVIADSDGRADRQGATVISLGAAGISPLRVTEHTEPDGRVKGQTETFSDLVAAAAGVVLGQRGRGAPVAVVRGVAYDKGDEGVRAILHHGGDA
ncbi:coenzyme F420-0:L-glutamate ligase [Streptomyces pathocidini]|uniref:Coenzyme F420-0:L-glutamate ligase n=1 Tax=Streptomyces pathocidini TaxID=1650571 RepID=A0ABW7UUC6_9ACTN|nr:coenzyme F420-0:L-glutamate ligase [Streptomyces pathocidini]